MPFIFIKDGEYAAVELDANGNMPMVIAAGTAAIGKLTSNSGVDIGDVTINNASTAPLYTAGAPARAAAIAHRAAIASADVVPPITAANVTAQNLAGVQGFIAQTQTENIAVIAGAIWGPAGPAAAVDAVTTPTDAANTHVIEVTIAQVTGATYYDLFCSTEANPLWVGRITEAQRAAGCEVLAVGVVSTGVQVAGKVNIGIVGTGIASNNGIFAYNNAFLPDAAGITAIDCTGKTKAIIHTKLAVADFRSAPALTIIPFFQNPTVSTDWHMGTAITWTVLTAVYTPLERIDVIDVNAAPALKVLVASLSGQSAAVTIHVQLV